MNILIAFFQCGIFILVPLATFGFGIRRILQLDEKYHRMSIAGLIGFISFEASVIGMIIDLRSRNLTLQELVLLSGTIGLIAFLFVILFLPVALTIFRLFKR
ncbi:MAG TPA: hypothetical protein VN843_18630 [Anaerolineales bacterium]|nr:hypothetical protein [Anaerolineales bacterium]